MTKGLIYDIQGYSVHDGPGIRTTVFLKGCPLSCPWCHSPESQSFKPQVCFKKTACMGIDDCGKCLSACTTDAILRGDPPQGESAVALPARDRDLCDDCGKCVESCPPKAFYVCGEEITVEHALERVLRDKIFYESSGGGVTLSGGEPLCQLDFSTEFLRACKESGLSTALDTTGFAPASSVRAIAPYVDLFLYDLKHLDDAEHRRATGVSNKRILENARLIASLGKKMQIRIPLIPLFSATEENVEATAAFCEELGGSVECVQLLPYHTLGVAKHERLQRKEKVFVADPLSDERAEKLAGAFKKRGINVIIH